MTRSEAIRILDPETTIEALVEIEYYGGFNGATARVQAVDEACVIAVADMREMERREQERKRGEWVTDKDRDRTWCSLCHANCGCNYDQAIEELNFCGNCGADMRRVDHE